MTEAKADLGLQESKTMSDEVVIKENYFTDEEVATMLYYVEKIKEPGHVANMGGAFGYTTSADADRLSLENPIAPLTGDSNNDASILGFTRAALSVKKEMEEFFGLELSFTNCIYAYMLAGAVNGLHSDNSKLDGTPYHEDEETDYSALVYLNSSGTDYKGGDLYFPLQEITLSPKSGMVVFFKGDYHHPHGVTEVFIGERKAMVLFFARKGHVSNRPLFQDEYSGIMPGADTHSGLTLE